MDPLRKTISFILLIFIGFSPLEYAFSAEKVTLKQRAFTNSLQRSAKDSNGKWIGFEIEISTMLAEICEVELEPIEYYINWTRALQMIKHGKLQLLTFVTYREKRTDFLDYIGPYDIEELILLVHKDNKNAEFKTLDDFMVQGRKYELVRNSVIEPKFDKRISDDPEFSSYFTPITGTGHGERLEYFRSIAKRVENKRVFGHLTDWYTFTLLQQDLQLQKDLDYDPNNLTGITINFLGNPKTYLTVSKLVPQTTRDCLRNAYHEIRENGDFDRTWVKWYGHRQIPPAS